MMSRQFKGAQGMIVDHMIRRSLEKRFHGVHWIPPMKPLPRPAIIAPNHNGWFDGYVIYAALTALGLPFLNWIQEYDAFPLFGKAGGMPFPPQDLARRVRTIRATIRRMNEDKVDLLLFPEGVLHYPDGLLSFGRSVEVVSQKVADCQTVPVGITYEHALHERPECFILFGEPLPCSPNIRERAEDAVAHLVEENRRLVRQERERFSVLVKGTRDVNERWDMRNIPRAKRP